LHRTRARSVIGSSRWPTSGCSHASSAEQKFARHNRPKTIPQASHVTLHQKSMPVGSACGTPSELPLSRRKPATDACAIKGDALVDPRFRWLLAQRASEARPRADENLSRLFVRVRRQEGLQGLEKLGPSDRVQVIRPGDDHDLEIPLDARQLVDEGPGWIQLTDYRQFRQLVRS